MERERSAEVVKEQKRRRAEKDFQRERLKRLQTRASVPPAAEEPDAPVEEEEEEQEEGSRSLGEPAQDDAPLDGGNNGPEGEQAVDLADETIDSDGNDDMDVDRDQEGDGGPMPLSDLFDLEFMAQVSHRLCHERSCSFADG